MGRLPYYNYTPTLKQRSHSQYDYSATLKQGIDVLLCGAPTVKNPWGRCPHGFWLWSKIDRRTTYIVTNAVFAKSASLVSKQLLW